MTEITLSEAWKRMAKPLARRFAPASPRTGRRSRERTTTGCVACQANHAWLGPVPRGKNIPLRDVGQIKPRTPAIPHPLEGRIAIVTDVGCGMRWTQQRRARNVFAGRVSAVSEQAARRRPALKRLRRDFVRQHMSRSKRFGGGSRGRQRRVVLAPVAGVKLTEIFRAQPGFGESSIRQRRRPRGIRLRGERAISR